MNVKIVPDEATRDTSGSPNIALKILEKIENSAVFIADITTITPLGAQRACPNPNVGYELGYAVAMLGWDRVILLFNTEHGRFPDDLPFDFIQNRASLYRLREGEEKAGRDELASLLTTAIGAVLTKNPKRPAELRGLTREKIEHDRDVDNMKWLMRSLHLPTLDEHILGLPHAISDQVFWFFENFRGIVNNSLFSLYDPVLRDAVDVLLETWTRTLSHSEQYHNTPSGRKHVFNNPGDMPLSIGQQEAWDEIDAASREMMQALGVMLKRLREAYVEIRIHKTNARAWRDYVAYQRKMDDKPFEMPKARRPTGKRKRK